MKPNPHTQHLHPAAEWMDIDDVLTLVLMLNAFIFSAEQFDDNLIVGEVPQRPEGYRSAVALRGVLQKHIRRYHLWEKWEDDHAEEAEASAPITDGKDASAAPTLCEVREAICEFPDCAEFGCEAEAASAAPVASGSDGQCVVHDGRCAFINCGECGMYGFSRPL